VRQFFVERNFLEVDTPVLVRTPALELYVDAIQAEAGWLRTSPEFHMKRLLAAGWPRIMQLGPCFRRGELGRWHNPEFTMLEWYRAYVGLEDVVQDVIALLPYVAQAAVGQTTWNWEGRGIDLRAEPVRWTVSQAFQALAGWDPVREFDPDRFDRDLVERVEPAMPKDRVVVLSDFPATCAAFARISPSNPQVAERCEVYVGGIELANLYAELTDVEEYRRRWQSWATDRERRGRPVYPPDEEFLRAVTQMPPAAGGALGFDRLVMLLVGGPDLDCALTFRERLEH
jgi:lysyl-tRNA synthetase class 2